MATSEPTPAADGGGVRARGGALLPLVFVAMPFGLKDDPSRRFKIDFDDIYERAIKPALERCAVEYIRADEERSGGVIHLAMFERLMVAEVAVVDVTAANLNVFYELGVRHAVRPRSTIIIGSLDGPMPFDIAMIRSLPYRLREGRLEDEDAKVFVDALVERLQYALEELEAKDSPIFQLIPTLTETPLPHEVTENFRDRARTIDAVRERLERARNLKDAAEGARRIAEIEREQLPEITRANAELVFDVLLSYRDVRAWDQMIALGDRTPPWLVKSVQVLREQLAFALNRRNGSGDRARAVGLLEAVIKEYGQSPEASSLLARIYKDEYLAALKGGERLRAGGSLGRALDLYRSGFNADPRDYYPGINLATLLVIKGTPEAKAELAQLVPAVSFALGRLGGLNSSDYWQLATVLELSVLGNDSAAAMRALEVIASLDERKTKPWMFETTANNLRLLLDCAGDGFVDRGALKEILGELEGLAARS